MGQTERSLFSMYDTEGRAMAISTCAKNGASLLEHFQNENPIRLKYLLDSFGVMFSPYFEHLGAWQPYLVLRT